MQIQTSCHTSCVMRHVSCVLCHVSCVIRHASCILLHVSCVTHNASCVMRQHNCYRKTCYKIQTCMSHIDNSSLVHIFLLSIPPKFNVIAANNGYIWCQTKKPTRPYYRARNWAGYRPRSAHRSVRTGNII